MPEMVDKAQRAARMGQRPVCIWLTGLPGSGKTTIARVLDAELFRRGRHATVLDGDQLRTGLNRDLGGRSSTREYTQALVARIRNASR